MSVLLSTVGIAATIASVLMLSAPIFTVRKMAVEKSIGVMTITFFCAQYVNCVVWSMYGIQIAAYPVVGCNLPGTAIATYCALMFIRVATDEEKEKGKLLATTLSSIRLTIVGALGACMVVFIIITILSLNAGPSVSTMFNGVCGGCCSVIMLGSPLGMARDIIRRRNAMGLQPLVMIFGTANSVLWTLYGIGRVDWFIIVPNTLCSLACFFQFYLLFRYGRRPIVENVTIVVDDGDAVNSA